LGICTGIEMSKRGPLSKSRENKETILQILDKDWQGLTFTELHNKIKDEIGSKSTLSKLLKELIIDNEVEKAENEKYRILESSLYNARAFLTFGISKYVNEYSKDGMEPDKMLEYLFKSIGFLSLYCAVQEIKTHRMWTEIPSKYVSRDNYLLAYLRRYIVYKGLESKGEELDFHIMPIVRKAIGSRETNLMEDNEFKAKILELESLVNKLCPKKLREYIDELRNVEYDQVTNQ
ncbi:unnamed protein product, partial [marine sediment metagenome]